MSVGNRAKLSDLCKLKLHLKRLSVSLSPGFKLACCVTQTLHMVKIYAIYRKHEEREFIGISGSLNVWLINVIKGDFSVTQISIGVRYQGQEIYLSAGWMVNVERFRDSYPRLFASHMVNNFTRVCYSFDTNCVGFLESKRGFLHIPIKKGSSYGAGEPLTYMHVKIIQDQASKDWLLQLLKDNTQTATVGYWPASLFPGLTEGASTVEWGGLVFRSQLSPGPTPMGSGGLPALGYSSSSHIKLVQYISKHHGVVNPTSLEPYQPDPTVYGLSPLLKNSNAYGTHFFYGGPGRRS
ncbi:protein neprosin-like [Silene latifolia]|uniref:protein neprosin-like n=1 Tax=Silene latifolia TaxID=37657 RepID=UPI003D77CAC3